MAERESQYAPEISSDEDLAARLTQIDELIFVFNEMGTQGARMVATLKEAKQMIVQKIDFIRQSERKLMQLGFNPHHKPGKA